VPCTAMYTNPGPKYAVPSGLMSASTGKDRNETLYESPAYTIGSGHNTNFKTLGPGPAAYKPDPKYTHQGKAGGPYAFATWKPKDPLERRGPGPTDYDTSHIKENAWSKLKGAPAASLGSRNKGPRMSGGPGPSAYNIEKKQLDLINYKGQALMATPQYQSIRRELRRPILWAENGRTFQVLKLRPRMFMRQNQAVKEQRSRPLLSRSAIIIQILLQRLSLRMMWTGTVGFVKRMTTVGTLHHLNPMDVRRWNVD